MTQKFRICQSTCHCFLPSHNQVQKLYSRIKRARHQFISPLQLALDQLSCRTKLNITIWIVSWVRFPWGSCQPMHFSLLCQILHHGLTDYRLLPPLDLLFFDHDLLGLKDQITCCWAVHPFSNCKPICNQGVVMVLIMQLYGNLSHIISNCIQAKSSHDLK